MKIKHIVFTTSSPPTASLLNELAESSRVISVVKVSEKEYLVYLEAHND